MVNGCFRNRPWLALFFLLGILACLFRCGDTVKHETFKTCRQSGFCKRNRELAKDVNASPYWLDEESIQFEDGILTGVVLKQQAGHVVRLPLTITFLESGVLRIIIDEEKRQKEDLVLRHGSKAQKRRYHKAGEWAISGDLTPGKEAVMECAAERSVTSVRYGSEARFEAVINHSPFNIAIKRDGQTHVQLNDRGFLNVEHWREQSQSGGDRDDSTCWEESFGGNTDSKPRGPESVGLDITFHGYEHVYGIPEHASSLSLKETLGGPGQYSEPYRLFNTDVFEYELDSPMALYGAIPFMQAHRAGSTAGIFWLNGAETWIDIVKTRTASNDDVSSTTQTHWFSEAGVLDVFVLLGDTPKDVLMSYAALSGTSQMPQEFAIGHHQCRWNYVSDVDVIDVAKRFDRHSIPLDVLWLDIEYTNDKKYFTWDPLNFPDPEGMHKHLDIAGRKQVIVVDPHIKNEGGYLVVDQLKSNNFAVKTNGGNDHFEGSCWPGSSYWIDCFNPAAVVWWKSLFRYGAFKGTYPNTFLWNDMGEPSVFSGPEGTMPRDNIHFDGWEHRDVHNIYGLTFHNATYQALLARSKAEEASPRRPFVLTRAFFAGSQRTSAAWTGDNLSAWSHLGASIPMILTNGIAGYPFIGADVPGYFGNPSMDLLARWYQAGAFYPFFRAHAHIDTRRREPYSIDEPHRSIMVQALRLRYQLLPAWYTAFYHAHALGEPIVRPNFYVHPMDTEGFAIENQMYLGSTGLLVRPVVEENATSTQIYLGDDEVYYDYFDYIIYSGKGNHTVNAPLEKIPLLMRGGHIFPRRERFRRSSKVMKHDPLTLVVVLPKSGGAIGEIYLDDGESFEYEQGAYILRRFVFEEGPGVLRSEDLGADGKLKDEYGKSVAKIRVERVVLVGVPANWKEKNQVVVSEEGRPERVVEMVWHSGEIGQADWAIVRDPAVSIAHTWMIKF